MSEEAAKHHNENAETQSAPKDLRGELQTALFTEFAKNLNIDATLPNAARESLMALLSASSSTSEDVIAALCLEDPIEQEVPSE
jgi:hypothetical protein